MTREELLKFIEYLNGKIKLYEIYKLQNLGYLNTNNYDIERTINIYKSKLEYTEKILGELK